MKKNIWIWNHYATHMYKDKAGRHYWIAENLAEGGYSPTVFCASTIHNSVDIIDTLGKKYVTYENEKIPFVFVRTPKYQGNGMSRIKNMAAFFKNVSFSAAAYAKKVGKPDVILASSVHPLTLVAGIRTARKFGIPCICEVRDLWPESLVAYGVLKRNSILARLLYKGEKWIYKKADTIIMTWEGGREYIEDQGWDKQIDLEKVKHICNGVVVEDFDKNSESYQITDPDLENKNYKNIVYAGSVRKVNNIGLLLDAAKTIQKSGHADIRFLIYGTGDEQEMLEKRCRDENINNVVFKGKVEKKYIPFILKKAYINILHNSSTSLDKYGQSQNKLFEYLAAGKCIVQTYTTGYSICEKYRCGLSASEQTPEKIAEVVVQACQDEAENKLMGDNARAAACDYDYRKLTEKLIKIIEEL